MSPEPSESKPQRPSVDNPSQADDPAADRSDIALRRPYTGDSLGFVLDVPVRLSVEIGRRSMRIAELLRLGPGSVLELNKISGEPLDVYANDRLVARGEAVVVGERYGVRLTEVLVNDDQGSELEGLL